MTLEELQGILEHARKELAEREQKERDQLNAIVLTRAEIYSTRAFIKELENHLEEEKEYVKRG